MNYNEQQLEAINSNERTIVCLAGAGSGKSSVLVGRINRLVQEGVNPNNILALTFTNAAAFEMGEKFKRIQSVPLAHNPEFRTFHGFCYSLIVKDKDVRGKLGYTSIPNICTDAKLKEIDKKVKLSLGFKVPETVQNDESRQSKDDKFKIGLYNKALRKALIQQNFITFDILCYDVCELFVKNDTSITKYKQQYRHLLVDECQDTDPKQLKFAGSFPATTSLFLVGDCLQNIYQFRGCTNEPLKQIASLPEWQVIKLYKNYRSTTQICNYANKFSTYAKSGYRIEMEGQREGNPVKIIRGSHIDYNTVVDKSHLKQLIEQIKGSSIETAVLCRTNKEVKFITSALQNEGIICTTSSKSSEAFNILKASLTNAFLVEWLLSCLDSESYSDYIKLQTTQPDMTGKQFISMFKTYPSISKRLDKIIQVRTIATDTDEALEDRFNKVCKLLRIKTKCKFDDSVTGPKELINMIMDQLEEVTDNNLYVGTIHSSKGLEYERVFVMGANDGMFKLGTEEMNNLFYVAITRAKNELIVFMK